MDDKLLINYIKNSFDIIVKSLLEERENIYIEERNNKRQDYETLLIKYEADIREHIKVEHQMKLYIDNLEYESEELKYKNKLKKLKIEQLTQKLLNLKSKDDDQSLIIIRQEETSNNSSQESKSETSDKNKACKFRKFEEEITELKKKLKNFEEKNKILTDNIKNLKMEHNKQLNDLKEIGNKQKKEIKELKKQLLDSEKKIKQLNVNNSNYRNMKSQQNFFRPNKNLSNSIKILNEIESNNSIHKKVRSKEKNNISFIINKKTKKRKTQPSSLSANSSLDKFEKYIKRKFSTLRSQKSQRVGSFIRLKKKDKNNSVLSNKKKENDFLRLFLNESNHQNNLTERIRSTRMVQKSDDNSVYYNKYCNKTKSKSKIKIEKKSNFKENLIPNPLKKGRTNNYLKKDNNHHLFEMINNINNINIFANNLKQNNQNVHFKSIYNNNSSFNAIYRYDISKHFKNRKKSK